MSESLACFRCGHSLDSLPLPLGRRDECPGCTAELHVCRMCQMYDPREPNQCAEEDALEVNEKERANFCDYFKPSPSAFSPEFMEAQGKATSELAQLFGDDASASPDEDSGSGGPSESDEALSRAEDLFKS